MASEHLNELMNSLQLFAETMLREHGEFYPTNTRLNRVRSQRALWNTRYFCKVSSILCKTYFCKRFARSSFTRGQSSAVMENQTLWRAEPSGMM